MGAAQHLHKQLPGATPGGPRGLVCCKASLRVRFSAWLAKRRCSDQERACRSMSDFEHVRKTGQGTSSVVHVMHERLSRWQVVLKVCSHADMQAGDEARVCPSPRVF